MNVIVRLINTLQFDFQIPHFVITDADYISSPCAADVVSGELKISNSWIAANRPVCKCCGPEFLWAFVSTSVVCCVTHLGLHRRKTSAFPVRLRAGNFNSIGAPTEALEAVMCHVRVFLNSAGERVASNLPYNHSSLPGSIIWPLAMK